MSIHSLTHVRAQYIRSIPVPIIGRDYARPTRSVSILSRLRPVSDRTLDILLGAAIVVMLAMSGILAIVTVLSALALGGIHV